MTSFQLLSLAPLGAMLGIAAVLDWRSRRIPNWLTFLMTLSGVAGSFLAGHVASPSQAILGMLVGFAIPFVLFAMGALGGGDVKLLAGIGAWFGPQAAISVFAIAAMVGAVMVIAQALAQRRGKLLLRNTAVLAVELRPVRGGRLD